MIYPRLNHPHPPQPDRPSARALPRRLIHPESGRPSRAATLRRTTALFLISILLVAAGVRADSDRLGDPSRLPPRAPGKVDFKKDIRPIFEARCHECHGEQKQKGDLRLDIKAAAMKGGEHGPSILPGNSARSPLLHQVAHLVDRLEMPPRKTGVRLTADEVGRLRAWIEDGADWPEDADTARLPDRSDLWSLQPLTRPALPGAEPAGTVPVHPVDAFVRAKLRERGFPSSPEADRRTLIRRLCFDLVGLPPTPDEIEAFLADTHPAAYERLVDRLLASPHYGERWARHWLDVVHYGETHGYDKDKPRPNAWPYRDYVIRALNEDKPYSRFVQEQIAGDVLFPGTVDGIEALGFLAAGPWDFIGHEEVPETKIDGRVARHLDRDDMVANTLQTFNSLTVQCAQCHDHKFDPISQEDYYSLQAVFAAIDRTNKKFDADPAVAAERTRLEKRQAELLDRRKSIESQVATRAGEPLQILDRQIADLDKAARSTEAFGYHSAIEPAPDRVKWVQVDLGRPLPIRRVLLRPCKDDFNGIGEGFGFPVRFKIEVSNDSGFAEGVRVVADRTGADVPSPQLKPAAFEVADGQARYVRVSATRLAPRQNDFIFALAELEVLDARGTNVALNARVTALDSIEAPVRWQKRNLTDGGYPGGPPRALGELALLRAQRTAVSDRATTPAEANELAAADRNLTDLKARLDQLPPQRVAYVGAVHHGRGAFTGTGPKGGRPRPIYILNRGNVQKPGREVGPGAIQALDHLPARFALDAGQPEAERRAALARWLTHRENPLTWRSIVNRVWQHHFGRGLVETPNDFGRMGARPTHPELLDWLAIEFRDGGQSLKTLHRLIVTSATYRQGAGPGSDDPSALPPALQRAFETARQEDSDNRFLWRQNRRKLDAESVRDAMLLISGKLDRTMGGPSFQDFVIDKPEHSPHYEYHLHDPEDPKSHRRSIYRFIVRSQQQPFMTVLDCADPSMQVGRRNESVSPLQALTLMNNALVVTLSRHFAEHVAKRGGDLDTQVRRAAYEALGSPPDPREEQAMTTFAREHGLPNLCRVLFNLNEFAFVD